ncbi:MAG: inositol-3-phosphate synthase [Candidatus Thermoplasmatota archaeon]|nr:inositol-3-phosphate synthase [Candidatus Thermoplasmatota archaeon]
MEKIKIAIIGVGNCASSLIQGIYYYKDKDKNPEDAIGLMHWDIRGYKPYDIEVVTAIDVDKRKVGKDVSNAIFAKPNCMEVFCRDIPKMDIDVVMGRVLDGIAPHMKEYPEDRTFLVSDEKGANIVDVLKQSGAEIVLNYLPVGSEKATRYYANCCLDANVAFINCIPVFIASNKKFSEKFKQKNLPIIGDDVKSQLGATITHRTLAKLFIDRGVKLDRTYQLNTGGNTDFLNMLARERLKSKKISKTEAVQSVLGERLEDENIHIGPSDYVPWQNDNKICFLRMEGRIFGNVPMNVELRLSVEDSPNSGGCIIDAIRCCKLALERKIGGPLISTSAYTMKHPPQQFPDDKAREMVEEFIQGSRER